MSDGDGVDIVEVCDVSFSCHSMAQFVFSAQPLLYFEAHDMAGILIRARLVFL